jgi:sodium/potassium-transporting ATPase subunit beta
MAEQSIIGTSPGLGLRPQQTDALVDSSMIVFNKDQKDDSDKLAGWGQWASRIEEFLATYKNEGKECSLANQPESGEACLFNLAHIGPCNASGHGYDVGQPCIFLKLNRIFGVANDPYNDPDQLPEEMPKNLKDHIGTQEDKNQVGSFGVNFSQPFSRLTT